MTSIGIIGAGHIGSPIAMRLGSKGIAATISNSRADGTPTAIIERLDRDDMPSAAGRIRDGFGRVRVVK